MKTAFRFITKTLTGLALLLLLYLMAAVVGSIIPVNRNFEPTKGEVEIFFRTNGVHTSLILPIENRIMDWKETVNTQHTLSNRTDFRYISFGWGDLAFYQNTPNWSDLTVSTAFRALFMKSPSALNVEFHRNISEEDDTFAIQISEQQYHALTVFIKDSFEYDSNENARPVPDLHYNEKDVFYRAQRHLTLFYTCNTWSNNALKQADIRACLWTPFDKAIFYQYNRYFTNFL